MQKTILVIEDEVNIAETLADILKLRGYMVQIAKNGLSGFSRALKQMPDLILCDVMMPEMDGFEVLEALRKHQQTRQIPFIFLTAKGHPENFRRGMDLGADDYLVKPVEAKKLYEVLESRLNRYECLVDIGHVEENHRVTSDLHDTLQQTLLGLQMKLTYLQEKTSDSNIAKTIDESVDFIKIAFSQLRVILENTDQPYHDEDFISRVHQIADRISSYVNFEIVIQGENNVDVPNEQAKVLFKVFFEILNNAIKHSKASKLLIQITRDDWDINVIISDNGCGFDINQIKRSFGLRNIRSRIESLGGNLTIDSVVGNGTIIKMVIKSTAHEKDLNH